MTAPENKARPNLRETRKEMGAAKRATPLDVARNGGATSNGPATKTTSKKSPSTKAAENTSTEKKAPKKAARSASTKLRWVFSEGIRNKDKTGQTAVAGDREYALLPDGDAWKATVKQGDETTTLAEGKFTKCYTAITAHNKAASEKGAAA